MREELHENKFDKTPTKTRPHVAAVFAVQESTSDATRSDVMLTKSDVVRKKSSTSDENEKEVRRKDAEEQQKTPAPQLASDARVVRDEGTGPPPVVIYSSLENQLQQQHNSSRSHSDRSDVSATSSVKSPTQPKRSNAILARAAYWDQRISVGDASDQNVDEFPQIPDEVFHR